MRRKSEEQLLAQCLRLLEETGEIKLCLQALPRGGREAVQPGSSAPHANGRPTRLTLLTHGGRQPAGPPFVTQYSRQRKIHGHASA